MLRCEILHGYSQRSPDVYLEILVNSVNLHKNVKNLNMKYLFASCQLVFGDVRF